MRKPIRKLYRLTPLNNEIKIIEAKIYKNEATKEDEFYLKGLKRAKELVKIIKETI